MTVKWTPSPEITVITSIDAHAAGEPLRIISGGLPSIPGRTILEKQQYVRKNLDNIRTALMWEPRGHADMYGCILTEPVTPDADTGVVFLHNEGYSSMCGHGVIALTTVLIETGMIRSPTQKTTVKIDSPAGQIIATAFREKEKVKKVSFQNVPAFVYALNETVHVPGLGNVLFDIAFGGAFYAFCKAEDFNLRLIPDDFTVLIDIGMRIKETIIKDVPIQHPFEDALGFLYGTVFLGPPESPNHFGRNVCVFAQGELDRSPTGTGVSARAALHYARGEIKKNQSFTIESILGTCFTGKVLKVTTFGPYKAVIPEITGCAFITGRHEWLIDPQDPLKKGFLLKS